MRSRSLLAARSRHPTQVRSGQARACVRPDMLKSTSPRRPHPFGARVERLLAKKTRLISVRCVVPRRRTSRAPGGVDRRGSAATAGGRRVATDGRIRCGRRARRGRPAVVVAKVTVAPSRSRTPAPYPPPDQARSSRDDRGPAPAPLPCALSAPFAPSAPSVCSVSGRMSMRQPVRRAARRAFCPSLPIASDSW